MEISKKELRISLYNQYGTQLLSKKQVAAILNISVVTLGRWKKKGINLYYKQNGTAKNAPIFYPLDAIVDYIVNNNTKIA